MWARGGRPWRGKRTGAGVDAGILCVVPLSARLALTPIPSPNPGRGENWWTTIRGHPFCVGLKPRAERTKPAKAGCISMGWFVPLAPFRGLIWVSAGIDPRATLDEVAFPAATPAIFYSVVNLIARGSSPALSSISRLKPARRWRRRRLFNPLSGGFSAW
ncbi:MAG: hypothetical protein KatS3mg059_0682 [Thermomicrobiales bacterium]|nr:MAG: hypothetical protein KatS3mg059_0682 [Thermomicrobiales bacterium]